jgi:hypothetical protein
VAFIPGSTSKANHRLTHTKLLTLDSKPRPLIDRHTFIMAVVAGAPKNNGLWWEHIHRGAVKALNRVFRDFDFQELEGDRCIRFGITFGEEYAVSLPCTQTTSHTANLRTRHRTVSDIWCLTSSTSLSSRIMRL